MFLLIKRTVGLFKGMSLRAWIGIVFVEILIVVIGVYVAAGLGGLQGERENRERQEFILETLVSEIRPFVEDATPLVAQFKERLESWNVQQRSGNRPTPYFIPATIFLTRPHSTLWSAMLQSGALGLMPVEFIIRVSEFYERTERMVDRFYRIDEFSRNRVLPFLDQGAEPFYTEGSDELKPMYDVYQRELAALLEYALETVELGRQIAESPYLGSVNAES